MNQAEEKFVRSSAKTLDAMFPYAYYHVFHRGLISTLTLGLVSGRTEEDARRMAFKQFNCEGIDIILQKCEGCQAADGNPRQRSCKFKGVKR